MAERQLEVEQRRLVTADLHHVDHVIRAFERGAAVECRGDACRGAERIRGPTADGGAGFEPLRIDVVEDDLAGRKLGEREDVAEEVLREFDAAGADEHDPRTHAPSVPRRIYGRGPSPGTNPTLG